jgi:Tfp pilus assembly protein PilF
MEVLDIKLVLVKDLLKSGRKEEAFAELSQLLSKYPEAGKLHSFHAHVLFRYLNQFDAAEEAFRKALRADGDDPDLYPEYAALLLQGSKYTEMVAVLNRALEVPLVSKEKIFALFGQLYERQQNWDEAVEYYTRAANFTLDSALMEGYLGDRARVNRKRSL